MAEKITSFDELLHALDHGGCIVDANRLQRELLTRLREVAEDHGTASGKLTLTLSFAAVKRGECEVGYSLKTEAPKTPTSKTMLYSTAEGGLVDEDPRQGKLKMLREPKRAPTHGGES